VGNLAQWSDVEQIVSSAACQFGKPVQAIGSISLGLPGA
jgi:hypothetical protein